MAHFVRLEHRGSGLLERYVGTAVEVRSAGADGFDELLRTDDPSYAPAWETEALGQSIDNEHVVIVNIDDVVCRANDGAIAVRRVVVPAVELIHDESRAVAAEILNLGEFRVHHHLSRWITWVGSQDDGRAAGDFFGDLVRVDVVVVLAAQGDGDRCEVPEKGQHFVISCVILVVRVKKSL